MDPIYPFSRGVRFRAHAPTWRFVTAKEENKEGSWTCRQWITGSTYTRKSDLQASIGRGGTDDDKFLNLPVKDLKRSMEFFTKLGTNSTAIHDETAAS